MARIACTTWPGGGNVPVFRSLADRLRAHGHDVALRVGWQAPVDLDGDVLLVDHITTVEGLRTAIDSGRPVAAVVHTLWSFVPSLVGTWAPDGYLDVLAGLDRALVCSIPELDRSASAPPNVRWVGPQLEPEGPDAGWSPPARSLVVVSLGTTDMGEGPILQRVLDALEPLPVDVVATIGEHLDPETIRVPANAELRGFVRHAALLPHADLFIGHGGHGGIMAALAFGVPMVLLPLDRDQLHNTARAAAIGVARDMAKDAEPATIRSAIEAVRTGVQERTRAIELANVIGGYVDAAVREVEALLR